MGQDTAKKKKVSWELSSPHCALHAHPARDQGSLWRTPVKQRLDRGPVGGLELLLVDDAYD